MILPEGLEACGAAAASAPTRTARILRAGPPTFCGPALARRCPLAPVRRLAGFRAFDHARLWPETVVIT
jgi:hypothetical protein